MKTTITVGQSVQVFQIGMPELWNKITVEKTFDGEGINEQYEIDNLFATVETAHKSHSQSCVDSQIAPQVKKETFADLKKELHVTPK